MTLSDLIENFKKQAGLDINSDLDGVLHWINIAINSINLDVRSSLTENGIIPKTHTITTQEPQGIVSREYDLPSDSMVVKSVGLSIEEEIEEIFETTDYNKFATTEEEIKKMALKKKYAIKGKKIILLVPIFDVGVDALVINYEAYLPSIKNTDILNNTPYQGLQDLHNWILYTAIHEYYVGTSGYPNNLRENTITEKQKTSRNLALNVLRRNSNASITPVSLPKNMVSRKFRKRVDSATPISQ